MSVINITEPAKPYWIVVSDEGPAKFPYKHLTYQTAYDESIRLSKLAPGIQFNVFKYGGHAFTPKPIEVHTTFHTYQEVPQYPYWNPSNGWRQARWYPLNQDDQIPF